MHDDPRNHSICGKAAMCLPAGAALRLLAVEPFAQSCRSLHRSIKFLIHALPTLAFSSARVSGAFFFAFIAGQILLLNVVEDPYDDVHDSRFCRHTLQGFHTSQPLMRFMAGCLAVGDAMNDPVRRFCLRAEDSLKDRTVSLDEHALLGLPASQDQYGLKTVYASNNGPVRFNTVRMAMDRPKPQPKPEPVVVAFETKAVAGWGSLSARFESGPCGIKAIGWDKWGGTSYWKYQLSSRMGAVSLFIRYLERRAPELAHRLREAAPADTGGLNGTMPDEWRRIADERPEAFENMQDEFIHRNYYRPAAAQIQLRTGVDLAETPAALREVLWSTAVHHGPLAGARIFIEALKDVRAKDVQNENEALLAEVFRRRNQMVHGSVITIKKSVLRRLDLEHSRAVAMLDQVRAGNSPHASKF